MEFHTNDVNVARYQIAHELCKHVVSIDNTSYSAQIQSNKDEYAIAIAKLIKKVVAEL